MPESSDKRDTAAPVCYGIVNAAGKLWMSESCIAGDEETLDVELEHAQDSDDTYRVVPLYAASVPSAIAARPIARPLMGDDLQMVFRALDFAGYDRAKVHPACYDHFSYTDFVYGLECELAVRNHPAARDIIEVCAKLADSEAASCQPGSPAEAQNWPMAMKVLASKIRALAPEVEAPSKSRLPSEEIVAWADRHGFDGSVADLKAAFDDARTL